jgi:Asp-tRNA(Asn)/Glu-tRNA(Gln) amidotransferase B subunit
LKQLLEYIGISDCGMEKSLRVDANVSVRRAGRGDSTRTREHQFFAFVGKR